MPLEASIKSAVPPNPKTPSADESPTLGMISPLGGAPAPVGVGAAWGQEAHIMQMFGRGEWGCGQWRCPRHDDVLLQVAVQEDLVE